MLIGEVSSVNDDLKDNFFHEIFHEPIGCFAEIEEDEAPWHMLDLGICWSVTTTAG